MRATESTLAAGDTNDENATRSPSLGLGQAGEGAGNRFVHPDVTLVELAPGGIGGMTVRVDGDLYHRWPVEPSHASVLVSSGIEGPANAPAGGGGLDYQGGSVVFNTGADNLIIADTNDTTDVYLRRFDAYHES